MFKLIRRNLGRNKKRTLFTLTSVMLAVLLLCLLSAVLRTFTQPADSSADYRVVVRNAISLTFALPESYWRRLETIPHVESVTFLNWYGGIYKDQRPHNFFAQFGADPATLWSVYPDYEMTDAEKLAWTAERTAFIAGKAAADKFGWKLGDQIFIKGEIYPVDLQLTLRGIYTHVEPSNEKQIFFHWKYVEEALGNPGIVGTYWLKVDSPKNVPAVIAASDAMFENSEARVKTETEKAFALSFVEMMGNIRLLFGSIGLAIIVSIFFITANTMAMAARERATEVAVLKTLGFRQGHVLGLVVAESLLIGTLGAALGCGLAAAAIQAIARAAESVFPLFGTLAVTRGTAALGLGVGVAVGILSGFGPGLVAARLNVVDGLRRVA